MIIVKIIGGLASQLNKYAVGRAISLQNDVELKLDLSWFENTPQCDTSWPFQLDKFSIIADVASNAEIQRIRGSELGLRIGRRVNKFFGRDLIKSNVIQMANLTPESMRELQTDSYLFGEAAGDILFRSIRAQLINEFQLSVPMSSAAAEVAHEIATASYAVSIHVRRGDFISNPNAARFHSLTDIDYFNAAFRKVIFKRPDAKFFVFSDDPTWVKNNLLKILPLESRSISGLQGHEDFSLMTNCRGNIICNSGFGWTSAWLNNAQDRIVVSPKRWLKDDALNESIVSSMFQPEWIYL